MRDLYEKKMMLRLLQNGGKYKSSEVPENVSSALKSAARSEDTELKHAAWLFVDAMLKPYQGKLIKKYGITTRDSSYEDYFNNFFLAIMENLSKWEPESAGLLTFFDPIFNKICVVERNKTSAFPSRYYEEVHNNIRKAENYLAKNGDNYPTPQAVKQILAEVFNIHYSVSTITKTQKMRFEVSSLETNAEQSTHDFSDGLIDRMDGRNDEHERFMDCVNKLKNELHKKILTGEYNLYEENPGRKRVTNKEVKDILRAYGVERSEDDRWVKEQRQRAEREFLHWYKLKENAYKEAVSDYAVSF